jgi:DNA-binding beta-propeller fold protein YncE
MPRVAALRLIFCALAGQAALPAAANAAPASAEVTARLQGPDGAWDYLSVDDRRHRIYLSRSYGVMMIDTLTGRAVEHFAAGDRSHSVVVVPDADVLVVTNSGDDSARIIDAASGAALASIAAGRGADSAVYDPVSRRVWVVNHTEGSISVIDPLKPSSEGRVQVGGILESAVVDGAGRLYVNVEDRHEIAVVDTRTRRTVGRYRLKDCVEPTGLALTDRGLLVAACDGRVVIVRASDGRRVTTLLIGHDADTVAYDPVRQRVYVPTGADGRLWMLDVSRPVPRLIGSLATPAGSRKATVDAATGDIYLPTARFRPGKAADGRPIMVPGSFSVWVLRAPR